MNSSVSIKVVTSTFLKGKKTSKISIFEAIILKQKRRGKIKKNYIFVLILECSCLAQLQIFWK